MKSDAVKELPGVIEQIHSRINSAENQRRLAKQSALNRREKLYSFNSWRWSAGISVGNSASPISGMSIKDMALQLGDVSEEFAAAVIKKQLESQIDFFDHVVSDTPVATQIFSNMGLSWLYTENPVGEICKVDPDTGAFVHIPLLKDSCEEWISLPANPALNFDKELHDRRMNVYSGLTGGMFPLFDDLIPLPIGSIFGAASRLRGDAELLMDFRLCPDDVHALMRYLIKAAKIYNPAWEQFMKNDLWRNPPAAFENYPMYIFTSITGLGGLPMFLAGEDHISADMFSETDYLEFVFPYQKEITPLFPDWYVHSCGNLSPFYKHIATLPNIRRVHVSPWSRLEDAVEAFGNSVILEIHLPVDFDTLSRADVEDLADHIIDVCGNDCTVDVVISPSENGRHYRDRILKRARQE